MESCPVSVRPEVQLRVAGTLVTEANFVCDAVVFRGPDWRWGDIDGGGSGRLIALNDDLPGCCWVSWDRGGCRPCRIGGVSGAYDLVYGASPAVVAALPAPVPPALEGTPSVQRHAASAEPDASLDASQMADCRFTEKLLGSGSFSTVHKGVLPSDRHVAVKVLQVSPDGADRDKVLSEVRLLQRLNHPNVVRYLGCHFPEKQPPEVWIFMEMATRGSLRDIVKNCKLDKPTISNYARQILEGLKYVHDNHVVHRDIKGANIMMDTSGVPKLADFGESKALLEATGCDGAGDGCTTYKGTPLWMAPEVLNGQPYGTKADVWSFGCTVVEMLSGGKPPWGSEFSSPVSGARVLAESVGLPTNTPADITPVCRNFLERCFERDPARRASVDELLAHPWITLGGSEFPAAGSPISARSSSTPATGLWKN